MKRLARLVLTATLLLYAAPTWAGELAADNFNGGSDNTALPTYSGNWVNPNSGTWNDCYIKTQAAAGAQSAGAACISIYTGVSFPDDQYVQATVGNLATDRQGLVVRHTNGVASDGYYGGSASSGDLRYVIRDQSDSTIVAGPSAQSMASTDVIKLQAVGTTISLFVNGTKILEGTDATDSSGSTGIYIGDSTSPRVPNFDDWSAGSIASADETFGFRRRLQQ